MRSSIDREIARLKESIPSLAFLLKSCATYFLSLKTIAGAQSLGQTLVEYHNIGVWRSTALSAPELWSKIPLSYPRRWVQEMLIRSKMAKLTIQSGSSLDTSNLKAIEKVRSCLYEMGRIEVLQLTAIPGLKLEEIFRDLPRSAPQLHTLCIGGHGGATTFSIHEDFLYEAERLRRVELSNCKIS